MTTQTRPFVTLLLVAAIAVPALAFGAEQARDIVLDFQSPGPMRDLLGKSLTVAKSFLFLSTFLGYALEAFGRSPTDGRDYGAVTWRLVVVLFLLWNYQAVFGSVINLLDRVEREVAPPSTWEQLGVAVARNQAALTELSSQGEVPQLADSTPVATTPQPKQLSTFTSWVYEALVTVVLLLGEGLIFLIRWLSRILTATLFILGPLALVAGIPRVSRTGSRWFLRFVTIASWPTFAGVLLAVMVALGGQGAIARSYLECLVAALVLLVTALSTPVLASHVVGGALQNFAGAGFASAKGLGTDGVVPAARMAGGAKGIALHVVQGLGGGQGSGGQKPPGGGGGRGGGGGVAANPPAAPRPRGSGSAGRGVGSRPRGPRSP
ncbi:MAG: hypothetical protein WB493_04480 [Anaeromyxobacteraceae bacterium]